MQFGYEQHLQDIDFSLPVDDFMTSQTLQSSGGKHDLEVYIGCTKWAYKGWVGNLYPNGTKDAAFLEEYSNQFNAIEFGPTFYDNPAAALIEYRYTSKVQNNLLFKFCPRLPQNISHIRRLKNVEQRMNQFLESLTGFDHHLGPILLQLPETFTAKQLTDLQLFIKAWPKQQQLFVEVRYKEWFSNRYIRDQLFESLHKYNVGAVISDTAGRRDVVHMQLPIPHAMVRFVGNNGHVTDKQRLDEWVARLKCWRDQGLQSLYFFMHQHDELFAPPACAYLIERLNDQLGLNIKVPVLINV